MKRNYMNNTATEEISNIETNILSKLSIEKTHVLVDILIEMSYNKRKMEGGIL